jgi:NAD+ kinase
VYVEQVVHEQEFPQFRQFDPHQTQVDFGITLGGDGTVLYLSAMFDEDVPLPPVICFAMGTLGFLTPFDAGNFK